jgi:hypothetical protein
MGSPGLLVGIALAVLSVGILHSQLPATSRADSDASFVPRPDVARVASLGFRPLVADIYWMQAVQVVGAELVNPARHAPLIGKLVDVVTTVDPWVGHPYRFAAHWLTTDLEQVRFANRLLERAVTYHPDDWRNWFYLGFNHFFYLEDHPAAAEALERASELEGSPTYLKRLVARLKADTAGLETAAVLLSELVRESEDPMAKAQYEAALLEIETERAARFLDEARETYRERNGRDIRRVEDLAEGPAAVLRALPPEPHGREWTLDDQGRIVSTYTKRRYEPWIHANDLKRRERWREREMKREQQGEGNDDGSA